MVSDIKFTIKYFGDEIKLYESTCLNEILCACKHADGEPKCCYTAEECKQKVLDYYKKRVEWIENQSIEEFLIDQGIYL